MAGELIKAAEVLRSKLVAAQERWAEAPFQRQRESCVAEDQARPNGPDRGLRTVAAQPARREIQLGLQAPIGAPLPAPGQVPIHKGLRLPEIIGRVVRRETTARARRLEAQLLRSAEGRQQ